MLFLQRLHLDGVLRYQKFLTDRIKNIEAVIDQHFDLIKEPLVQQLRDKIDSNEAKLMKSGLQGSLKDKLDRQIESQAQVQKYERDLDDLSVTDHEKRLELLNKNKDTLVEEDKSRVENVKGVQTICRIQASRSQTFFVFDNHDYHTGRDFYYQLLDENHAELEEYLRKQADMMETMANL